MEGGERRKEGRGEGREERGREERGGGKEGTKGEEGRNYVVCDLN